MADASVGVDPVGAALAFTTPAPVTARTAFKEARPLSEQITECLKFLRRIEHVAVSAVVKGDYVIDVYLKDGKGISTPSCSTKQSYKNFINLHTACVSWSSRHPDLAPQYGVPKCLYCGPIKDPHAVDQWPSSTDKLFMSKKKMMRVLEARLNEYVQAARGEKNGPYLCEGIENIPSLVAVFLLKGVDTSTL
ncbi:hypothetical protein Poli38472_000062 [Pythium oligandrum]|uniref:Uncharacterized protein n=1 Tax=Pythium oligandrum TaxID=41045 RepID=A0A8K1CBZ8_PYTOL|nr:hypothetical protein Poli38472_000062 [Pythium oligandrum]|eukprot:TMW60020.1 hypothetical protein Poli38472_000062 [Pythium oligandrum]